MPTLIKAISQVSLETVMFRGRGGMGLVEIITDIVARGFRVVYIQFGESIEVEEVAAIRFCPDIIELNLRGSDLCIE